MNDERLMRQRFTPEMVRAYSDSRDVNDGQFETLLEEKAKQLESSMSCVVFINKAQYNMDGWDVDCYYTRNASADIIKRGLDDMHSEVMREIHGKETYW